MPPAPNECQQLILEFFPIRGGSPRFNNSLKKINLTPNPRNPDNLNGEVCRNEENKVGLFTTVPKSIVPPGNLSWDMVPDNKIYKYSDELQKMATGGSPHITQKIHGIFFIFKNI